MSAVRRLESEQYRRPAICLGPAAAEPTANKTFINKDLSPYFARGFQKFEGVEPTANKAHVINGMDHSLAVNRRIFKRSMRLTIADWAAAGQISL